MNGVLGGFKNMLKRWRINLKNKKKNKKNQKYKHPKLISFIYSVIAIIYCPFGYLFSKDKKRASIEKPNLYKKVEKINIKLDEMIIGKEHDIKTIEKEIEIIKKEIETPMSTESRNYFVPKLKEIETIIKFIKNPNKISDIEAKKINESLEKNIKKLNKPKKINKNLLAKLPLSLVVSKELLKDDSNFQDSKKINQEKKENFIEETNGILKKTNTQIKTIEMKIDKVEQYNHFYDLENQLKYLKKQIELLKEKYKIVDNMPNINLDKYELKKIPKKIDELLQLIDKDLKLIESKKQEMLNKKEVTSKEEEPKKQPPKKTQIKKQELDDAIKAQQIILNNIINQNKYFDDYIKKLAKSTNKKRTILTSLSNFASTIFNFTISLLPISIFKNKILGTLVSSIMINNSIKTMRKMLNPNLEINYQLFIDDYIKSKDILYETYELCNDSLFELSLLKQELILFDNNQTKNILLQIELIEKNIQKQIKSLNIKKETLEKVYVKVNKNIY